MSRVGGGGEFGSCIFVEFIVLRAELLSEWLSSEWLGSGGGWPC